MTMVISQCSHCARFDAENEDGNFCEAFLSDTEGIPAAIFLNEFVHDKPHPKQIDESLLYVEES